MTKRSEVFRKLHEEGMTYEQIGRIYGISRQAVYDAAHHNRGDCFHRSAVEKIKWVGLRNWMLENRVSIIELSRRIGLTHFGSTISRGLDPRKSTIDSVLRVTGLTYEECFREEEMDEE